MKPVLLLAAVGWAVNGLAQAQVPAPAVAASAAPRVEKTYSLDFKPVILDTGSSGGTSLGLDYDLKGKYEFAGGQTGVGQETIDPKDLDITIKSGQIDMRARGTLASTKEKNPNKLLDFSAAGVFKLDTPAAYYKVGGVFAFETDQAFDDRQTMFGVAASVSKVRIVVPGDAGSVLLNYGSVRPDADAERKKLTTSLETYRRWNLEVSYSIPVNQRRLRSIDFDYRHYQETGAPSAVRAAGLDRHQLGLVRANLDQDFFIQYSRGSLPFDARSERAVRIGWSLKFE